MAQINNQQVTKGLADNADIQIARDKIPNELAEKIVPTFETNPKLLRRINIVASASANNAVTGTIYTTPIDKDFFLTSIDLSMIKDVTSTSIYTDVEIKINGQTKTILYINGFTLTVQNISKIISFPIPIKLDRNSTITVNNNTNVANISSYCTITGYTNDNSSL